MGQTQARLSRARVIPVKPKDADQMLENCPTLRNPSVSRDKPRFLRVVQKKNPLKIRMPGRDPRVSKPKIPFRIRKITLKSLAKTSPSTGKATSSSFSKKFFSPHKKAAQKMSVKRDLIEAYEERITDPQCVLLQAFKLMSSNHLSITLEDVEKFIKQHLGLNLDYHELREMFHMATNSYEITYDQFLRIMSPEWEGATTGDYSNVDTLFSSNDKEYETTFDTTSESFTDSSFVDTIWDSADSNSDLEKIIFDSVHSHEYMSSESLLTSHPSFVSDIPVAYFGSDTSLDATNEHPLDLRGKIEMRKQIYGKYCKPVNRSFSTKNGKNHTQFLADDATIAKLMRSNSVDAKFTAAENEYRNLIKVFEIFDQSKTGKLSYKDLCRAINYVGLPAPSRFEMNELFKLVNRTIKDSLTASEFVKLFALCQDENSSQNMNAHLGCVKSRAPRVSYPMTNIVYKSFAPRLTKVY